MKNFSPNAKLALSSATLHKDKKDISKKVNETNQRLENNFKQKNIDFVDNSNIIEEPETDLGLLHHPRWSSL